MDDRSLLEMLSEEMRLCRQLQNRANILAAYREAEAEGRTARAEFAAALESEAEQLRKTLYPLRLAIGARLMDLQGMTERALAEHLRSAGDGDEAMCELREKRKKTAMRRELASWQRAAVGLLLLALAGNMVLSGLLIAQQKETERLEAKYRAARTAGRKPPGPYPFVWSEGLLHESAEQAEAEQEEKYLYVGECTLTAYCCEAYPHICGTGDGLTATGIPVAPGIVAVDPEVIPLGSTVIINGTSYLAADTGAAIKGSKVDIAVATHEEALEYGVRTADVWIVKGE